MPTNKITLESIILLLAYSIFKNRHSLFLLINIINFYSVWRCVSPPPPHPPKTYFISSLPNILKKCIIYIYNTPCSKIEILKLICQNEQHSNHQSFYLMIHKSFLFFLYYLFLLRSLPPCTSHSTPNTEQTKSIASRYFRKYNPLPFFFSDDRKNLFILNVSPCRFPYVICLFTFGSLNSFVFS